MNSLHGYNALTVILARSGLALWLWKTKNLFPKSSDVLSGLDCHQAHTRVEQQACPTSMKSGGLLATSTPVYSLGSVSLDFS